MKHDVIFLTNLVTQAIAGSSKEEKDRKANKRKQNQNKGTYNVFNLINSNCTIIFMHRKGKKFVAKIKCHNNFP